MFKRMAHHRPGRHGSDSQNASELTEKDGEKFEQASELEASIGTTTATEDTMEKPDPLLEDLNHYRTVDEVWHFSTIDWGRRYVCLGYNTLHATHEDVGFGNPKQRESDLPAGRRIWSWLLLCEDKTVISITEDPFHHHSNPLTIQEKRTLREVRRNILNVFRQLSHAHDSKKDNPIQRLPIRKRVGNSNEETAHRSTDAPGILLYCLFDDWYTTFSLISKREQRYGYELNKLVSFGCRTCPSTWSQLTIRREKRC
jgi:hypothetical protein